MRMPRAFFPLSLSFLALSWTNAARSEDWKTHARHLTGETERKLRKDPELSTRLVKALDSEDRFLSLDVISALRMRVLLPELLRFSERDSTGYSYHSINTLLEPADYAEVLKLYEARLASGNTSMPSKLAILDSLTRLPSHLPETELKRLLREETPEIRSAALYYLRNRLLKNRRKDFLPLLKLALRDPTFQIRAQAEALAREIHAE